MIIGKEEWTELLRAHALWFSHDYAGERARLAGQDLRAVALRGVQLSGADLRNLRIDGVEAWEIQLEGADLWEANLENSSLRSANLRNANLQYANLAGVDFWGADLRGAKLVHADLTGANLTGADLREADLRETNLARARFNNALMRLCHLGQAVFEDTQFYNIDAVDIIHPAFLTVRGQASVFTHVGEGVIQVMNERRPYNDWAMSLDKLQEILLCSSQEAWEARQILEFMVRQRRERDNADWFGRRGILTV